MSQYGILLSCLIAWMLLGCASVRRLADVRDPLSPAEHVTLGDSYLAHGERPAAIQQYQSALDGDRRQVPALVALGNLAYEDRAWNKARHYFRRALKASPGNPGIMNNLAMVDVAEGKHLDRAQKLIEQALPTAGPLAPYLLDTQAQIARRKL